MHKYEYKTHSYWLLKEVVHTVINGFWRAKLPVAYLDVDNSPKASGREEVAGRDSPSSKSALTYSLTVNLIEAYQHYFVTCLLIKHCSLLHLSQGIHGEVTATNFTVGSYDTGSIDY
jgi:hypothetical protein